MTEEREHRSIRSTSAHNYSVIISCPFNYSSPRFHRWPPFYL